MPRYQYYTAAHSNCSSRENLDFVTDNLAAEWQRVKLKPNTSPLITDRLSDHILRLLEALLTKDEVRSRKSSASGKKTNNAKRWNEATSSRLSSNVTPTGRLGVARRMLVGLHGINPHGMNQRLQLHSLEKPTNNRS